MQLNLQTARPTIGQLERPPGRGIKGTCKGNWWPCKGNRGPCNKNRALLIARRPFNCAPSSSGFHCRGSLGSSQKGTIYRFWPDLKYDLLSQKIGRKCWKGWEGGLYELVGLFLTFSWLFISEGVEVFSGGAAPYFELYGELSAKTCFYLPGTF